jgi:hypothetical protein
MATTVLSFSIDDHTTNHESVALARIEGNTHANAEELRADIQRVIYASVKSSYPYLGTAAIKSLTLNMYDSVIEKAFLNLDLKQQSDAEKLQASADAQKLQASNAILKSEYPYKPAIFLNYRSRTAVGVDDELVEGWTYSKAGSDVFSGTPPLWTFGTADEGTGVSYGGDTWPDFMTGEAVTEVFPLNGIAVTATYTVGSDIEIVPSSG